MFRIGALVMVFGLVGVTSVVVLVDASCGASSPSHPPVRRLLVVTLPAVTWSDLESVDLRHLQGLVESAAAGSMSLRAVHRFTSPGEGYVTLGAGTRAVADDSLDNVPVAPDPSINMEGSEGKPGPLAETVDGASSSGVSVIERANRRLPYGAVPGALGEALRSAGVDRAVIANADTTLTSPNPRTDGRDAVAALMDRSGRVPGTVSPELLTSDAAAPFGVGYQLGAVVDAFDRVWNDRTVVLVEASDLARVNAAARWVSPSRRVAFLRHALRATDELIGRLLTRVRGDDAVLLVTPFHSRDSVHLGIAALRAPGVPPGLLRSALTRRTGFVTSADFAPTILSLFRLPQPAAMEGRPFVAGPVGGAFGRRPDFLVRSDARARFRDSLVAPVTALFVLAQLGLALVAWRTVRRGRPTSGARLAALGLLFVGPATWASGLLPMERLGRVGFALFVVGSAAMGAILVERIGRRWRAGPLRLTLAIVVSFLAADVLTGARLQFDTPFGYSPTVAGRFAGFGNLAFAQVAAASILLAGLYASCWPGRRGRYVATGILAAVLVVDGMPMWGAKVGSVLVSVPAFGVTAVLLFNRRIRLRTVALLAVGLLIALGGFALVDLSRPAADQTHLARLVDAVAVQGWSALTLVVTRKAGENLAIVTSSVWALMLPVAVVLVLFLLYRPPWPLRRAVDELPTLHAAFVGLSVAATLGFALNDSGIAVPGMMLAIIVPAAVYLSLPPNARLRHMEERRL